MFEILKVNHSKDESLQVASSTNVYIDMVWNQFDNLSSGFYLEVAQTEPWGGSLLILFEVFRAVKDTPDDRLIWLFRFVTNCRQMEIWKLEELVRKLNPHRWQSVLNRQGFLLQDTSYKVEMYISKVEAKPCLVCAKKIPLSLFFIGNFLDHFSICEHIRRLRLLWSAI